MGRHFFWHFRKHSLCLQFFFDRKSVYFLIEKATIIPENGDDCVQINWSRSVSFG